jgi:hypothetical protein
MLTGRKLPNLKIIMDHVRRIVTNLEIIILLQKKLDQHGQGKWEGNKRARVTRGSRNPKHGKRKALNCAQA